MRDAPIADNERSARRLQHAMSVLNLPNKRMQAHTRAVNRYLLGMHQQIRIGLLERGMAIEDVRDLLIAVLAFLDDALQVGLVAALRHYGKEGVSAQWRRGEDGQRDEHRSERRTTKGM